MPKNVPAGHKLHALCLFTKVAITESDASYPEAGCCYPERGRVKLCKDARIVQKLQRRLSDGVEITTYR